MFFFSPKNLSAKGEEQAEEIFKMFGCFPFSQENPHILFSNPQAVNRRDPLMTAERSTFFRSFKQSLICGLDLFFIIDVLCKTLSPRQNVPEKNIITEKKISSFKISSLKRFLSIANQSKKQAVVSLISRTLNNNNKKILLASFFFIFI